MTDKEISNVLEDVVIIVDSREQKNQHITSYFTDNNIKYRIEKLDTADYSLVLPNYPELELDGAILIERKGSLDEICGNFTTNRDRFIREFERIQQEHIHMVIENATWGKILKGSYRSKFTPKAFLASLMTWNIRYNCPIWMCRPEESPVIIYNILRYELLEQLKNIEN